MQRLQCVKDAPRPSAAELTGVKAWDVGEVQQQVEQSDPESQYNLVSVKIESNSAASGSVTRTWKFNVWSSDALFKSQQRLADRTQKILNNSRGVINQARQVTGDEPLPPPSPLPAPNRNDVTDSPYCVTSAEPI